MREFLRTKVRDLEVTGANPHYEGSITLGPDITYGAQLLPYEKVQVLCVETGARIETYVIEGKIKGQCEINGPATRLIGKGDNIMVLAYEYISQDIVDIRLKNGWHPLIWSATGNEEKYQKNKPI